METDQSVLLRENQIVHTDGSPDLTYISEDANIVGHNGTDTMIGLSPVQIQQEYFENLADCDWVK